MRTLSVAGTTVLVLEDEHAVAHEAAQRTVDMLADAVARRDTAHLLLTGGSSAVSLFADLGQPAWHAAVPWDQVHFWWGDDRFVPSDHPQSNAGLAYSVLFEASAHRGESGTGAGGDDVLAGDVPALPIDPNKVHPIDSEAAIADSAGPEVAAARYAALIETLVPRGVDGVPVFDVVHQGIGPDGHTMSIFPDSPALAPDAPLVMGIAAPTHVEPHLQRVTLTPRVLPSARLVVVMSTGEAKADVMAQVLGPERDPARWPAQINLLPNAIWLLDEGAASKLPR